MIAGAIGLMDDEGVRVGSTTIQLDWAGYYERFKREHGGDPVCFGNRLLFQDGWMYSAKDPSGPEWAPPSDTHALQELQLFYWRRRRNIVRNELTALRRTVESLRGMQHTKSVPLQQHSTYFDDDKQQTVMVSQDLDLSMFDGRLAWLRDDLKECNSRLVELAEDNHDRADI